MGHRIAVMNSGVLQQLDTPQNLYDHPANLFVATFIGSPAMNVFPATVASANGGAEVKSGDVSLKVPALRAARLRDWAGKGVTLGIRPEHFHVVSDTSVEDDGTYVRLPVELVEPLGSETLLHVTGPDGETLVARVEPDFQPRPGEVVTLRVDVDQIHAFDPDTEQALT